MAGKGNKRGNNSDRQKGNSKRGQQEQDRDER